jgi:hypothetical protein
VPPIEVGANVDEVPLGLSAFGVVTADEAALGFVAPSPPEAAAAGFVELGPATVGAEPGVGTTTPCAPTGPASRATAQSARIARSRIRVLAALPFATGYSLRAQ